MSPENCDVFSASEREDFSRNSGILQLTKMEPFLVVSHARFSALRLGGVSDPKASDDLVPS